MTTNVFCGQCGNENPRANKFCHNCGAELVTSTLNYIPEDFPSYDEIELVGKYAVLHKKLTSFKISSGYLVVDYGKYFVQFIKEDEHSQLNFEIGFTDRYTEQQLLKVYEMGFKVVDKVLVKNLDLDNTAISTIINEVGYFFDQIICAPYQNRFKFNEGIFNSNADINTPNTQESISSMDQSTFDKKYGWKIAFILTAIFLVIYFFQDPAERNQDDMQSKVESNFSAWDGSHTKLVAYTKSKLRDPDSFEHVITNYKGKDDQVYIVMEFRSKNGFGGLNNATAYAHADKITGDIIDFQMVDN